jgi:release factor glutamine methyltransferase
MNILELIQKTTAYFEKAGVPNPRLDVELLLAHALALKRMDLYMQFERVLTEPELDKLRPLVKRRSAREPLQHILGTVDFCNLTLTVNSKALIPRHETEILVQKAIECLGKDSSGKILDIGTGTGAIVLAILQSCPSTTAVAVDLSEDALTLAKQNAENSKLQSRIEFRNGNLFEAIQKNESFEMIVSNPPYIPSTEIAALQKEVQFDPVMALDGGADGLDLIRKIIAEASQFLKSSGFLLIEIGLNQHEAVRKLLEEAKYTKIEIFKDLQGVQRIVKAQKA